MIRPRSDTDRPALLLAMREVHDRDAYPSVWPADPAAFLNPPGTLGAWVAVVCGTVTGQVVLRSLPDALPAWALATGLPGARMAVMSRFFLAPAGRGTGAAEALFRAAWADATARGLRAVLDVHVKNGAAIRLYDRLGWAHVATVNGDWRDPDGSVPRVRVYVSPE